MADNGKILVFTGEGKGKTTSALGLAWQAVGRLQLPRRGAGNAHEPRVQLGVSRAID